MEAKDLVVALDERRGKLIKGGDLLPFFKQYNNGEEGFDAFLKDKFVWRAPNSHLVKFYYDPFTGKKIDWEQIKREHLKAKKL